MEKLNIPHNRITKRVVETCYQCYISKTDEKKKKEVGCDFEHFERTFEHFKQHYTLFQHFFIHTYIKNTQNNITQTPLPNTP